MDSQRLDSVWNAFSKLLQAIPKSDLSTCVLCLMIYLMSYDLCLILCLMTYVLCLIWCLMSYALMALQLVYVLLLGLRLAISWLVSMHCLLSTCHFLLILIPFEEPPHLTADLTHHSWRSVVANHNKNGDPWKNNSGRLLCLQMSIVWHVTK